MIEKRLGKIDFVEFGSMKDYPFQLGLQLGFSMSGSGVMDGGKYTVNMSPDCHWEIGTRHTNLAESLDRVAKILNDAKVNYISELLGDKFSRFKTLSRLSANDAGQQQVTDESIRDTLMDLANYAIMTILEMDEEKGMETPDPNAASMAIGACSARSDIRAGLR